MRSLAMCLAGLCGLFVTVEAAELPPNVLRQDEDAVARSIVRINRRTSYRAGGSVRQVLNFGTGVIIGAETVHGCREYLVLSNEHVARNEHVAGENALSIVKGDGVAAPVALETVAIDERMDQALLRTTGCRARFAVPPYVLGAPHEDVRQDAAFTEGYGNGKFNTIVGDIVTTRAKDWGVRSYRIDVPVGGGQSGAPLVVIGNDRRLYLPALIFCGNERYTAATPLRRGKGVLGRLKGE